MNKIGIFLLLLLILPPDPPPLPPTSHPVRVLPKIGMTGQTIVLLDNIHINEHLPKRNSVSIHRRTQSRACGITSALVSTEVTQSAHAGTAQGIFASSPTPFSLQRAVTVAD